MFKKDWIKFGKKIFLLLVPFIAVYFIELLVLPIDFFTFRSWEALVKKNPDSILTGQFYPNMFLEKIEIGDLAPHTIFSQEKKVIWQTDDFGYRNKGYSPDTEIVILGDSTVVGTSVSQEQTLAEVLAQKTKKKVYSFSTDSLGIDYFLNEQRFRDRVPPVVIVAFGERILPFLKLPQLTETKYQLDWQAKQYWKYLGKNTWLSHNKVIQKIAILRDRIYKKNMINYFRAKKKKNVVRGTQYKNSPMIFLNGEEEKKYFSTEEIENISQVIVGYKSAIEARGERFIFMPVPNKETVYYDFLPSQEKSLFLSQLFLSLKEKGVDFIDLDKKFFQIVLSGDKGDLLYHLDDIHWNKNGIEIASQLITDKLK